MTEGATWNSYLSSPTSVQEAVRQVTAPNSRTLPVRNLPCLCCGTGRKRPTINCQTRRLPNRSTDWIDTAVIQKSWSQKLPWKREIGGACSRDWGVESRAKGGHERPGFIPEAPAGMSREPLGRERKEGVPHKPWGLARWGEWGLLSRLGQGQPEWEGLCNDDPTWISHKFPGFLRRKVTNSN